jgi:hypothetical protein
MFMRPTGGNPIVPAENLFWRIIYHNRSIIAHAPDSTENYVLSRQIVWPLEAGVILQSGHYNLLGEGKVNVRTCINVSMGQRLEGQRRPKWNNCRVECASRRA